MPHIYTCVNRTIEKKAKKFSHGHERREHFHRSLFSSMRTLLFIYSHMDISTLRYSCLSLVYTTRARFTQNTHLISLRLLQQTRWRIFGACSPRLGTSNFENKKSPNIARDKTDHYLGTRYIIRHKTEYRPHPNI